MHRTNLKALVAVSGFFVVLTISSIAVAGVPTFDEYSHILRDLQEKSQEVETGEDSADTAKGDGDGDIVHDTHGRMNAAVERIIEDIERIRTDLAATVQSALARSEEAERQELESAEDWIRHAQNIRHQALVAVHNHLDSWEIDAETKARFERRTTAIAKQMNEKSRQLAALASRYDEASRKAARQAEEDLNRLAHELEDIWRETGYLDQQDCDEKP